MTRIADVRAAAIGLLLVCAGCASPHVGAYRPVDFGPIASQDLDLTGARRGRALGPFIEHRSRETSTFRAFRPLWSRSSDAVKDRVLNEWLWPLGTFKRYGCESDWRFLCAFGHDFDTGDPLSRERTWVLPVWFSGRDLQGEGYVAVFPVGGSVHEFLGRDEIDFALFPLYLHTRINEIESHAFMWPIVSWTYGDDVRRFRVFPFYGYSRKDDAWRKQFVLWPLWTSVRYQYPGVQGKGFLLFPLGGHARCGDSVSTTILPPFFSWRKGDGEKRVNCPWPFVQYASGEEVDKLYLWPVWGVRSLAETSSGFVLWPIMTWENVERESHYVRRRAVMPFIYYQSRMAQHAVQSGESDRADTPVLERYFKFWPLVSYHREESVMRLRVLALWPGCDAGAVERNYAPLWSLYSRRRSAGDVEDELLWGLCSYRRNTEGAMRFSLFPVFEIERDPGDGDRKRWSLLKGLIGWERRELNKRWRLLYWIRF